MRAHIALLLAGSLGCGTTLPTEDSVILRVESATVAPGTEMRAVLVNNSSERLGVAISCWLRFIDQVSREPTQPQEECDANPMFFEPGRRLAFTVRVPVTPGVYRLEAPLSAIDPDSESGLLSVRSQTFTVTGPASRK